MRTLKWKDLLSRERIKLDTILKMVMTTRFQERCADSCTLAGTTLAMMATYGISQRNSGLFILRGMCSRFEHHAMLHLISFVVLDTSEGVVIPGSPELVTMLRGHYLAEVRGGLLGLPPNAFPPLFTRRLEMFDRQEKVQMDSARQTAIEMALEIVASEGCQCARAWDDYLLSNEAPCADCKSVEKLLLRLGFVTRDDTSNIEHRLMGAWWDETIHEGEPVPLSEPLDGSNCIHVKYVGPPTPIIRIN
jgi:hypothetical protein